MFDLVLKDGLVRNGFESWQGDVAIQGEKIAALGHGLVGRETISAKGKWVIPGGIDVHTHMSLPFAKAISADDFFTGTVAAAFGGITSIIDFTAQLGNEGLRPGFERRLLQAKNHAVIDYGFHACIGKFSPAVKQDLHWAAESGLTSLKMFTAYGKSGLMMNDSGLYSAFNACRELGILPTLHAENGVVIDLLTEDLLKSGLLGIESLPLSRPPFTELEAVRRCSQFAKATRCPVYFVHVSCGDSADQIGEDRRRGYPVWGETCPQYLFLEDSLLTGVDGHYFSCCPPIRPAHQQPGLWKALREGNLQVIATDHCPFTRKDKDTWNGNFTEIPMGLPGVETLLPVILGSVEQHCWDVDSAIRALSVNPAKMFGLFPQKGAIQPGADADLVIFHPKKKTIISRQTLHMATDYSIFEGKSLKGCPEVVISRGERIIENGGFFGRKGRGEFLLRKKSSLFG